MVDPGGMAPLGANDAMEHPDHGSRAEPLPAPNPTHSFQVPRFAWKLARTVVTVVVCCEGIVALFGVWLTTENVWRTGLALLLLGGVLSIQLFHFSRQGARFGTPLSYGLLALQAALAYLPLLILGQPWVGVPAFLAGSVLLALPPLVGSGLFVAIVASMAVIQGMLASSTLELLYTAVAVAAFGLYVFLLTRLADLVGELTKARGELALLAVAEEQLRFARDLHDLLGISLSAITLKGELAYRLVRKYPARARGELAEILTTARRALADVHSVAAGYQELSLEQECAAAELILGSSEVTVRMDLDFAAELPATARTLLGTVLREGTTNILRHSKAENCAITVRQADNGICLDVVNDGLPDQPRPTDAIGGSGLRNVAERVAAQGGLVTAEPDEDGQNYRLHVWLPLNTPERPQLRRKIGRRARPEDDEPDTAPARQSGSSINGWSIRTLIALAFVFMATSAIIHIWSLTERFSERATGIGYLVALLVLQLAYFSRVSTRLRSPLSYALLFVQACLVYLPLVELGQSWISLPGFLVGCALLVLPPVAGWTVFAGVIGVEIWHFLAVGPVDEVPVNAASVVLTGLVVFGLISLTKLVTELTQARQRLATMAIAQERLRFAQDLHGLLGRSLSTIVLNGELTQRLLERDPERAATELTEILQLARQALADVRSIASGYRVLSLDSESESARSVLCAADVAVRMRIAYGELPVPVRGVLAVALREGVTNILQHSDAHHCDIEILRGGCEVSLDIVNDGVRPSREQGERPAGSGLRDLTDRVRRLGGELTTATEPDGRFRLHASLPV